MNNIENKVINYLKTTSGVTAQILARNIKHKCSSVKTVIEKLHADGRLIISHQYRKAPKYSLKIQDNRKMSNLLLFSTQIDSFSIKIEDALKILK